MENAEQRLQHQIDAEMKFQKDAEILNPKTMMTFPETLRELARLRPEK